jgi:hypothetical protein
MGDIEMKKLSKAGKLLKNIEELKKTEALHPASLDDKGSGNSNLTLEDFYPKEVVEILNKLDSGELKVEDVSVPYKGMIR